MTCGILYSVWIRRGPDVVKYDLEVAEDALRLVRLGEHWEKSKPPRMLQKRMDLLLYKVSRERVRRGASRGLEEIPVSEILEWSLVLEEESQRAVLRLRLRGGREIEINMHPKLYRQARRILNACLGGAMRRAR